MDSSSSSSSSTSSQIPQSLLTTFHGCTVAVAGKLPGITHDEIKRLVVALGGSFEAKDVSNCTHLITSSEELKTLKVSMARENENCQFVSYDWLCESVSEDPSGIKELLGRISTLTISDGQRNNKRQLDEGSDSSSATKKQKINTKEPIIPIETQQDGSKIKLTVHNLPKAVIDLMRFLLHKSQKAKLQARIRDLSRMVTASSDQRSRRYLKILQFFYKLMNQMSTNSLYCGLLKLQLTEITVLDKKSIEFVTLANYYTQTSSRLYAYAYAYTPTIVNIFRIERHGEAERFANWSKENQVSVGDRRLLWHGSQQLNFIGILSHGLCDDAPPTGRMNKGVYLAEAASLSIPFCRTSQGEALMLLCEVECGKNQAHLHWPIASDYKWRDASFVHPGLSGIRLPDFRVKYSLSDLEYLEEIGEIGETEYIIPDPAQIRQRYLFHLALGPLPELM